MGLRPYKNVITENVEMDVTSPSGSEYTGFYSNVAVDRSTTPKGWTVYDIRHENTGMFCSLEHDTVIVNNAGSFVCKGEIPELAKIGSSVNFRMDEEDWKLAHTNADNPDATVPSCPAALPTDWDYNLYS